MIEFELLNTIAGGILGIAIGIVLIAAFYRVRRWWKNR